MEGFEGGGGGKKLTLAGFDEDEVKRDLMVAEAEEGRREDEGVLEDDLSSIVRRSQRQDGQNPENCSSGWRSQLKEERGGCGGRGGGAVGSAKVRMEFISI